MVPYSEPVSWKSIERVGKIPYTYSSMENQREISQVRMSDFVSRLRKRTLWESEIPPTTHIQESNQRNVLHSFHFVRWGKTFSKKSARMKSDFVRNFLQPDNGCSRLSLIFQWKFLWLVHFKLKSKLKNKIRRGKLALWFSYTTSFSRPGFKFRAFNQALILMFVQAKGPTCYVVVLCQMSLRSTKAVT